MSGNGARRWCILCYLLLPLSGWIVLLSVRHHPGLRFHARQSTILGSFYIGILMALSLLDALGGATWRWAGAFVATATPLVGLLMLLVWLVVVTQIIRGRPGHVPWIGHWVD